MYNQLDDSEEAIWSFLLASGYLKVLQIIEEDTLFVLCMRSGQKLKNMHILI